jgi:predicted phosphodiesterase
MLRIAGFLLLSLVGAATAVSCFGTWTYHWRAFDIQIGMTPAFPGQTRLIFAPLGEVRARTHPTPVALKASLRGISFDEMKRLIAKPPPRHALELEFRRAARRSLRDFALRQIALGALGALFVPFVFRLRRPRWWLLAALSGGSFVALVFFATLATFQPRAFRSPTYAGSLGQAQWVIALVEDAFNNTEALGSKLRNVASNLNVLYGRINAMPALRGDEDTIKILHVSDIHNNPAAVSFVRDLAEKIGVDAVIDTGDLTDFGTPPETALSRELRGLAVPYVFVAGNHDSQATMRAVGANPGAIVLSDADAAPVTVAGLRVLGAPDPSAARPAAGDVNTPEADLESAGEALLAQYVRADPPPDIVCVHNPRQAEPLIGVARLILCGHMHRAEVREERGTIICNAGTTGAAGARYFERPEGVPFSAAILHFARAPRPHLLFIDQVVLDGALNRYSITRRTFNNAPNDEVPARAARF